MFEGSPGCSMLGMRMLEEAMGARATSQLEALHLVEFVSSTRAASSINNSEFSPLWVRWRRRMGVQTSRTRGSALI
jgi:hypothetical protein